MQMYPFFDPLTPCMTLHNKNALPLIKYVTNSSTPPPFRTGIWIWIWIWISFSGYFHAAYSRLNTKIQKVYTPLFKSRQYLN